MSSLCGVVAIVQQQFMMPSQAWNLRGCTRFVWDSTALLITIWNRSFHDPDILFAKKVPARKFATINVDGFDESGNNQLSERVRSSDGFQTSKLCFLYFKSDSRPGRDCSETDRHRRPSIAESVTDHLEKQQRQGMNGVKWSVSED